MQDLGDLGDGAGQQVALLDRIRSLVLSGRFPPGAVVPEAYLAEEFDVSRTPVREVLKRLEHEGLVEIRPKVGTFVREPTRREIIELFQIKESLEGLAASLIARRGDIPELTVLRRNLADSEVATRERDTDAYARLVHEFHWTLVRGADNRKLVEHYERLMNQLAYQRLVLRTVEHPGRIAASTQEHRAVLEMIEHKDPFGAESAMRNHVYATCREALIPEPDSERGRL
jgi:DNA-binding GntR family transcriptional regulator